MCKTDAASLRGGKNTGSFSLLEGRARKKGGRVSLHALSPPGRKKGEGILGTCVMKGRAATTSIRACFQLAGKEKEVLLEGNQTYCLSQNRRSFDEIRTGGGGDALILEEGAWGKNDSLFHKISSQLHLAKEVHETRKRGKVQSNSSLIQEKGGKRKVY